MAQLTITIPDAIAPRVLDGFATTHNYTGTDPQGNPETKGQFAKRKLIDYIKLSVRTAEAVAAQVVVQTSVETDIILS